MYMIAYVSESTISPDREDQEIANIVERASAFNAEQDITGVLFHQDRKFMQILEGEMTVVKALMEKIAADTRHKKIKILADMPVVTRDFHDWNLKVFNLAPGASLDEVDLDMVISTFKRSKIPSSEGFMYFFESLLQMAENPETAVK